MKFLQTLVLTFFALASQGQQIFSSLELQNNEPKTAFYIFVKGDIKDIKEDVDNYLKSYERPKEENGYYLIELNDGLKSSELVAQIAIKPEENKSYNRLLFFFLDENGMGLADRQVKPEDRERFIYDLYDLIRKNDETRLVKEDLELAESIVKDATKAKEKIEKSIERNLKDQEKLGKRLDATPEELTKLIDEKNSVLQEKLTGSAEKAEDLDSEKLDKALSKADKEILKRQKKEKKDSSKLETKEQQLEELTEELFVAKSSLKKVEEVLIDKKRMMLELLK